MEFIPYKANECFEHLYYQIPMELFFNKNYKDKLNPDSKILYGFLLNRLTLSIKNNWLDEEGNVFLIFTRKEVQELLNLSDKTATKAFKQYIIFYKCFWYIINVIIRLNIIAVCLYICCYCIKISIL